MYEGLAKLPPGQSVRELLGELGMPETELREALRKLDRAGLVQRTRGTWAAVPLERDQPAGALHDSPGMPVDD